MDDGHVLEELQNIVRNAPLWPGSTLSHATADACVEQGWAERDADGRFVPTDLGRKVAVRSLPSRPVEA